MTTESKVIKKAICAYCKGKGRDHFQLLSTESVCQVCCGTGNVNVNESDIKCHYCKGTGKNPLGARVPCIVCKGKGCVPVSGSAVCPICRGGGTSCEGLTCLHCNGKGVCSDGKCV